MIGLSALLAGCVSLRRETLVLEGGVGLAATLVAILLVARVLPAAAAAALLAVVLIPYLAVLVAGRRLEPGLLRRALGEEHRARHTAAVEHAKWVAELLILPVVVLIVAGSTGMVEAALALAERWSVPQVLVGTLVLATLTSLPNAFTAVRLGFARRGSALVSETLNSNTINLVGAVVVPALAISLSPFTGLLAFDLAWLVGMTAVQLALLAPPKGCGRTGGGLVIALYAVFVGVQIAYGS